MTRLLACIAALSLAACGGPDMGDAEQTTTPAPSMARMTPDDLAGTYRSTTEDGLEALSILDPDGTYRDTIAGETTETGTWTGDDRQVCFTSDAGSGASPGTPVCFNLGAVADDGTVVITNSDGEAMMLHKDVG